MVADFLTHLRVQLQPFLKLEIATMKEMQHQLPSAMQADPLMPSDRHFLMGLAQESTQPPELPDYFSVGNCMEGLGMITEHIYGVKLVVTPTKPGEVWHPDVVKLVAHHATEGILGTIYCDLFARADKNMGAAQYTLQTGRRVVPPPPAEPSYQNPIVALVCGFRPAADGEPALLSMTEVETLFHETGHALHSMFGRTRFQTVAGTRCSLDFVELPSMLMEFFVRDYRVVSRFARHYKTGAPLSQELFERGIAAQDLFPASGMADSAVYAEVDQRYHSKDVATDKEAATAVLRGVQEQYTELNFCGTALQYRFSHFSGYAASYYSYLWCKGLAALIWTTSFVDDPLSRSAGDRYRKSVLAYGSARDPWLMVEDVLGYKPTPEDVVDGLIRATFTKPVDPLSPKLPRPNKFDEGTEEEEEEEEKGSNKFWDEPLPESSGDDEED